MDNFVRLIPSLMSRAGAGKQQPMDEWRRIDVDTLTSSMCCSVIDLISWVLELMIQ